MERLSCPFVLTLFGVFLLIVGAGLNLFGVERINATNLIEMVVLENNPVTINRWIRPNRMASFKVHIFNVTNPKEIIEGSSPQLTMVGPYVYKQKTEKVVLKNLKNLFVYKLNNSFSFDVKNSGRWTESDEVTIAHVPFIGAHFFKNNKNPKMTNISDELFLKASIKELLFDGVYVDCAVTTTFDRMTSCQSLSKWPSPLLRKSDDKFKFSFFHKRNGVEPEVYTVHKGNENVQTAGQIIAINGTDYSNLKKNISASNAVKGTDGTQFSVPLNLTEILYFYDKNYCRFIPIEFDKMIRSKGIKLFRYLILKNFTRSKVKIGATVGCPTTGPSIVASFPKFYLTNKKSKTILGTLNSSKQHHQTYLDIEPNFGITIMSCKRFQFNVDVKKISNFQPHKSKKSRFPILFPILWTEEKITVTDDYYKQIRYGIIGKQILEVLSIGFVVLGIFLISTSYPTWFGFNRIERSVAKVFSKCRPKIFPKSEPKIKHYEKNSFWKS